MAAKFPTNFQQLNINADKINVDQIKAELNKFEVKVINYGGGVGNKSKIDKIGKDIQSIRDHVDKQNLAAKKAGRNDTIKKIGNVATKNLNVFDDISSNDPCRMMKGSVEIVESVLSVVGGNVGYRGRGHMWHFGSNFIAVLSQRARRSCYQICKYGACRAAEVPSEVAR